MTINPIIFALVDELQQAVLDYLRTEEIEASSRSLLLYQLPQILRPCLRLAANVDSSEAKDYYHEVLLQAGYLAGLVRQTDEQANSEAWKRVKDCLDQLRLCPDRVIVDETGHHAPAMMAEAQELKKLVGSKWTEKRTKDL